MSRLVAGLTPDDAGLPPGIDVVATSSGRAALESVLARCRSYRRIVGIGFFGGIGPLVKVGDILLPSRALSLRRRPRGPWSPNEELTTALLQRAQRLAPAHTGVVGTVANVVAGGSRRVLSLRERGVVGVDMETAYLFAGFSTVSVAALLVCSDHVILEPLPTTKARADRRLPLTEQIRSVAQRAFLMTVRLLDEGGGPGEED